MQRHLDFRLGTAKRHILSIPGFVIILTGIALWCFSAFFTKSEIGYGLTVNGQEHLLIASVEKDKIVLSDHNGFRKEYSVAELDSISKKHIVIIHRKDTSTKHVAFISIAFGLCFVGLHAFGMRRENRFLSIIIPKT